MPTEGPRWAGAESEPEWGEARVCFGVARPAPGGSGLSLGGSWAWSLAACCPATGLLQCRGPLVLPPGPLQRLSMQKRDHAPSAPPTALPVVPTPHSQLRQRSPDVGHGTERCIQGICNSYRNETAPCGYNSEFPSSCIVLWWD
uniref:Uncharacterized protein n=1 Tax=Falco tinnunculus TaxID=100819 RepID=A0A8C4UH99_FALTI